MMPVSLSIVILVRVQFNYDEITSMYNLRATASSSSKPRFDNVQYLEITTSPIHRLTTLKLPASTSVERIVDRALLETMRIVRGWYGLEGRQPWHSS
ncbi:hypothetical protein M378DRAFT_569564 [Amanita muscaria Koide BX008]|uniref:Uncharacterized protein n=1 Tax=Amanita muscaria (strain Koide BX008) TaxID=946122 RepID=A0A0C2RZF6_AMAMK|nr:hypothetical protein M378DRAFT_569564 [Amanita muscaria Koide BX008]